MQSNEYFCTISKLPDVLTPDEEQKLLKDKDNPINTKILVESNLRLVIYISKKYQSTGIDRADLISIGTVGLIKAIKTYLPEKNVKLATYISKSIENEILMFLRKEGKHQNVDLLSQDIITDNDGNKKILEDFIADETCEINFTERYEMVDILNNTLTLALNNLKVVEKISLLMILSGKKQKEIGKKLNVSQSYTSRVLKNVYNNNKYYAKNGINKDKKYKFIFMCTERKYELKLLKEIFKDSKETFLQLVNNIPKIEMNYDNINFEETDDYFIIELPKIEESFLFMAEVIIQLEK